MLPIRNEIEKIQSDFSAATKKNKDLAGNIKHEFQMLDTHDYLEKLVLPYINEYEKYYPYMANLKILSHDVPVGLEAAWVNFQRKHEFNPVHNHTGIMSFVIWVSIPYNIEEEKSISRELASEANVPGHFEFQFINSIGEIHPHYIPVDKSMEDCIIVFPARMTHCVYPFYTSDDYRISVAGNFNLKTG